MKVIIGFATYKYKIILELVLIMYSNYIALTIFLVVSLIMPFSLILTSILLRKRTKSNPVSRGSYESAETSAGSRISIMNEYIHFFSMFIAFEVLVVFILLWVVSAHLLPLIYNIIMIALLIFGFVFEMLILLLARMNR
jgi:NADH:ubiquinone oxidoreductase subunit 3 (subunit A)